MWEERTELCFVCLSSVVSSCRRTSTGNALLLVSSHDACVSKHSQNKTKNIPYKHILSLAYFRHFWNSPDNSTHDSSSHFALKCAFFTSMNMSFISSWPCSRLCSRTRCNVRKQCFRCLQWWLRRQQVVSWTLSDTLVLVRTREPQVDISRIHDHHRSCSFDRSISSWSEPCLLSTSQTIRGPPVCPRPSWRFGVALCLRPRSLGLWPRCLDQQRVSHC